MSYSIVITQLIMARNDFKWSKIHNLCQSLYVETSNTLSNVPVVVTEKLDGANVGVDMDGNIYGRENMITSETYQGIPIEFLKEYDIKALCKSIFNDIPMKRFIVYGELMCNINIYDYDKRGLYGTWCPFGIKYELESIQDVFMHATYHEYLIQHSTEKKTPNRFTIHMNNTLRDKFLLHKFNPVNVIGEYISICEMTNILEPNTFGGEGVVVIRTTRLKNRYEIDNDLPAGHGCQALKLRVVGTSVKVNPIKVDNKEEQNTIDYIMRINQNLNSITETIITEAVKSAMTKIECGDPDDLNYIGQIAELTKGDIEVYHEPTYIREVTRCIKKLLPKKDTNIEKERYRKYIKTHVHNERYRVWNSGSIGENDMFLIYPDKPNFSKKFKEDPNICSCSHIVALTRKIFKQKTIPEYEIYKFVEEEFIKTLYPNYTGPIYE